MNKSSIDIGSELTKALQYYQTGKFNKAEEIYKKILEIDPDHSESLHLLGVIARKVGKNNIAMNLIKKAIRLNPGNPFYYNNLGNTFKNQGMFNEAIASYNKALKIKPDLSEAYYNLGNVLKVQGRLDEAVSCYQKALDIKPDLPEAHNNMGVVLKDQGKFFEAIYSFKKALKIKPGLAEVYNNIGTVLSKDQGKLTEAITCYQRALKIKPDYAEACHNLGTALKDRGKLDESISCFQKALDLKPGYTEAYSELFCQLEQTCDWERLEAMTAKLDGFTTKALNNGIKTTESPFVSLSRNTDISRNSAIARSWSNKIAGTMSTLNIHFAFDDRGSSKKKITIGYLSNDFRDHAMAHLTLSLYGLHSRDEFNIFCYSYGEDDGSYYGSRIKRDSDNFVDIRSLGHAEAARRIYEDQVDILVDLKGHTRGSRLEISALRPAPVQVRYLGLPCTTGADFFDYIITDRIASPEDHAQHYSENYVYLPHCYQINDHTQVISNIDCKRSDFELPEMSFVFCSFNQSYKIEPVMFNTWMKVLGQVPEGVLWLPRGSETTEKNLRREAESKGVIPDRLVFSDKLLKEQHLGRLRLADLALDTRIVNGMITTSDALWAGVPVITLQGSSFAARASSSILAAIGVPELITQSPEDYESLAVDLACNKGKLQTIRNKILKNRLTEPLFDTPVFTKNLESAYKEMWKIFASGEKPRQIEVVES